MTNTGRTIVLNALLNFHRQQNDAGQPLGLVDLIFDRPRFEAFVRSVLAQSKAVAELDLASVASKAEEGRQQLLGLARDVDADLAAPTDQGARL